MVRSTKAGRLLFVCAVLMFVQAGISFSLGDITSGVIACFIAPYLIMVGISVYRGRYTISDVSSYDDRIAKKTVYTYTPRGEQEMVPGCGACGGVCALALIVVASEAGLAALGASFFLVAAPGLLAALLAFVADAIYLTAYRKR